MVQSIDLLLPRDPMALAGLRNSLRRWLAGLGVDPVTAGEVVLATHEAAANVVDHTDAQWFSVEATADDAVRVVVSDPGSWDRDPAVSDERGRGFQIMRHLTSACAVVSNEAGTTIALTFPLSSGIHVGPPGANGRVAARGDLAA
jgi:anti-sigma regulatory factor (Ser/Thr protein kinase)